MLVVASGTGRTMDLEPGDVIQSVNGQTVKRPRDVIQQLERVATGESVKLGVIRRGANKQVASVRPDQLLDHVHVQSYAVRTD